MCSDDHPWALSKSGLLFLNHARKKRPVTESVAVASPDIDHARNEAGQHDRECVPPT